MNSALTSDTANYPTGRSQHKQGSFINMPVNATAASQGVSTQVSVISTYLWNHAQGEQGHETITPGMATAAPREANMSASAMSVHLSLWEEHRLPLPDYE